VGELSYSANALNALSKFHRRQYIVYVEGDDDISFWSELFSLFGLSDFHMKVAGGKPRIEKLANSLLNDEIDVVVARDCDYSDLLDQQRKHKRILYTYGYSIENSMYCASSLAKAINIYSHSIEDRTTETENWLTSLLSSFEELIIYDVANEKFGKRIGVMSGSCVRFLKSNNSHFADQTKINKFVKDIKPRFATDEIDDVKKLLKQSKKPLFSVIRGHFLTNAIMNFIKNKANLTSMSHDMLYGQMIAQLSCCSNEDDMQHVSQQIRRLAS
jgi:hypothetical protein